MFSALASTFAQVALAAFLSFADPLSFEYSGSTDASGKAATERRSSSGGRRSRRSGAEKDSSGDKERRSSGGRERPDGD